MPPLATVTRLSVLEVLVTRTTVGPEIALKAESVTKLMSNVLAEAVPCIVIAQAAGGIVGPGIAAIAGGATPQATGTITFSQFVTAGAGFTAVFTASVVRGVSAQCITYSLF